LAIDCQLVNGLTSNLLGLMCQNLSNIVAGVVIAFIYEWRISLVTIVLVPLMILSSLVNMQFSVGYSQTTDAAYKDGSNLIM
jgi:ATP-binding cassette subfamily B (MDR/TAP) protein 1